jgi:hypothetical protein
MTPITLLRWAAALACLLVILLLNYWQGQGLLPSSTLLTLAKSLLIPLAFWVAPFRPALNGQFPFFKRKGDAP